MVTPFYDVQTGGYGLVPQLPGCTERIMRVTA